MLRSSAARRRLRRLGVTVRIRLKPLGGIDEVADSHYCASLAARGSRSTAQAQNLSIATGGTGGVYYPLGGGMAAVLSKYVPGMQATAEVTGGSVANLQLIGTGKPYIALTMADAALDALQGRGQVHRQAGPGAHADGPVPEPHARGDDRGHRHQQDGRPQGQARLHRLGRQRHRGDGVPRHRGGGPRQGQGHEARAPRRRRVGERAQGPQDRRLLLGRRPADRGGDRPRQLARREDQDDRPRRPGAGDEQEVRQPLRQGRDPARTSTRAWTRTTSRRR